MPHAKPCVVSLGEVLWDILPSGRVLGGAPANVAWHALQLGAEAHVVSAVGDDPLGGEIVSLLGRMGLGTEGVAVVPDKPTGTVDAAIDAGGNATYTIHPDVAWDVIPASPSARALAARADALTFGSLASRTPGGADAIRRILATARPGALRVLDINLRPPHFSRDTLASLLGLANILKLNHEELPVLADFFALPADPEAALAELPRRYPELTGVVVTRGAEGAWWLDADGLIEMAPEGKVKVADTVGAGDSLTAAVILGLLKGLPKRQILAAALRVASYVCSCRGATPVLPDELKAGCA